MNHQKGKTVLVVAAHPDDEVLGCGATMAAHAAAGDAVHLLILAEGVTSRRDCRDTTLDAVWLEDIAAAAREANHLLGVSSVTLLNLPDNRLDTVPLLELIKLVEQQIVKLVPDTVYTHHWGDLNVDHRLVHQAVLTACRPLPGNPVKRLFFFEVPSSSEWQAPVTELSFVPNWYQDVTATMSLKLQALELYRSEIRDWPHSRSYRAVDYLAKWRGASVGVEAAEAFVLGRALAGVGVP